MIKWLLNLFNKQEQSKENEFEFSVSESVHVGDRYIYKVKASNKQEAFEKLVKYFYGKDHVPTQDVKQEHFNFTYPQHEQFWVNGMPLWFGQMLSGRQNDENRKELEEYCIKHNIERNETN